MKLLLEWKKSLDFSVFSVLYQCLCGSVSMWVSVYLGLCLSGLMSMWVSVYLGRCLSGLMSMWVSVYVGHSLCGFLSICVRVCIFIIISISESYRFLIFPVNSILLFCTYMYFPNLHSSRMRHKVSFNRFEFRVFLDRLPYQV